MKLTGKCKEDFLKWYYYNNYHHQVFIETSDDIFINALIIEFFDSIKCAGFKSLWSYAFGNSYDPFSDNWNEYIEKEIEQSNLIYNERV